MKTLVLFISYDGTNYAGWQVQKNALTIQECIDDAIYKVSSKKYYSIGSGRTDSGVHAFEQVASVIIDDNFTLPHSKIQKALNRNLPSDIQINSAIIINRDFNARFDAIFREYKYYISNKYNLFDRNYSNHIKYPMDIDLLFRSADIFKRKVDFTTFSKLNPDANNPVCNVIDSYWEKVSENKFVYTIKANHFMYGMVRSLVGAMIDIARKKRTIEEVENALLLKDRTLNSPLAQPHGLFLNKVDYPKEFFL